MQRNTANAEVIAVFGLGYVGCVTSACLASLGHRVIGVDKDSFKVEQVRRGESPFYEPGLTEVIRKGLAAGLLTTTTEAGEALQQATIALICVGTPSEKNGNLGLGQLRRVAAEIAGYRRGVSQPLIVAVRSTVFPGTCEELLAGELRDARVEVVSNPEFLREGTAVKDFEQPSLIVVGGSDERAVARVAGLYDALNVAPCLVSLRTAEMIKYACNAFHAVKIAFANEVGALAERLQVSPQEVMATVCADTKLNASAAYLKPGFAFGGSCLPKDLRALVYRASRHDVRLPMLEAVLPSNDAHLRRAIERVLDLPMQRIGIFGLSFKENTDDLRESPAVGLIEQLLGKGREVRIYDPHIAIDDIYGSNRSYVLNAIPHVGRLMVANVGALTEWAEAIVLTQKPSAEMAAALHSSEGMLVDLAGAGYDRVAALQRT